MIRAGREVVDTYGIDKLRRKKLRGKPLYQITSPRPWDLPGWPAPVNPQNTRPPGTKGHSGGRKRLWDLAQAQAFLSAEPIPAIDATDHDGDLLDVLELAEALKSSRKEINELVRQGRLDGPDAKPCGVDHWTRAHVRMMRPAPSTHRPAEWGIPQGTEAAQIQRRLRAAVKKVPRRAGGGWNATAIAREANVHRTTAIRFLKRLDAEANNSAR